MKDLISVIIPVYNVAAYLRQCLDSIAAQTYHNLEIICVDDCSKDGSSDILREYAKADPRFRVFTCEHNIGAALARNCGMDEARGEYVYFMDSDDWIEPDYLQVMVATLQKAQTDIVLNLNILQETGNISKPYDYAESVHISPQGEYWNKWRVIAEAPCLLWARLYKRAFLEKYHLRLSAMRTTCDDYIFHYISNVYAQQTFLFYGSVYHYRIHQQSITGVAKSQKCWDLQFMRAYDAIYDYFQEHKLLENCPIKLFNMMSCFMVDNAEKFDFYKAYFEKTSAYFAAHKDLYNELDLYFRAIVLESATYDEYRKNHIANVTVDYLRKRK